jgi:ribosomal protein L37AE/L43A
MAFSKSERAARKAERVASAARTAAAQAETRSHVAADKCPQCGRKLRQNLAITGWWQCSQYGAVEFRVDSAAPSCSWQGFTQ